MIIISSSNMTITIIIIIIITITIIAVIINTTIITDMNDITITGWRRTLETGQGKSA